MKKLVLLLVTLTAIPLCGQVKLQSLIDTACHNGGGRVHFPAGTFTQDIPFALCSAISIDGEGRAQGDVTTCPTTILTHLTTGSLFPISGMNLIHISDMCLKNIGSGSGASTAIELDWGQFVTVERTYISGDFNTGIALRPGAASTIWNHFIDNHITLSAPNSVACLLDSGSSVDKVVNNNSFDNTNCVAGSGGTGFKTTGNGPVPVINETFVHSGELSATNGIAVSIGKGTTRNFVMFASNLEGSYIGLNVETGQDGLTCIGCNISANSTNTAVASGSSRTFITGNIGGKVQTFAADENGNVSAASLSGTGICLAPAACYPNIVNLPTGTVIYGSGATVATVYKNLWQFSKPVQLSGATFSTLGKVADGTLEYCADCAVRDPCTGGGSGALAVKISGRWVCK